MTGEYQLIERLAAKGYTFTSHTLTLTSAKGHGKNTAGLNLEGALVRVKEGYPVIGVKGGVKLSNGNYSLIIDADAPGLFEKLLTVLPQLATTLQIKGSKLGHYYVETDAQIDKAAINMPNGDRAIDLLGAGAMAVAPPSPHRKTKAPYSIIHDADPIFIAWGDIKGALITLCMDNNLTWVGVYPKEKTANNHNNLNGTKLNEEIKNKLTLFDLGLQAGTQSCPLPGHRHGDQSPSMSVSTDGKLFNCFSKHGGGDIFTYTMLKDTISFPEAKGRLAKLAGIEYMQTPVNMPDDDAKTFVVESIPAELWFELQTKAQQKYLAGVEHTIKLYEAYPFSWAQVKAVSRKLTLEMDTPCLVLPKFKTLEQHPAIKQGGAVGKYCIFEAQVVMNKAEGGKTTTFDLVSAYDCLEKDEDPPHEKIHHHWNLLFPGELQTRGIKKADLGFRHELHHYAIQSDKHHIQAFCGKELELGQVYRVGGLLWSAEDKKNTRAIPFHEEYMLIDWAVPMRNLLEIDSSFFDKFKGLTHDQMRDSVAFPFENSVSDYMELTFLSVFYIKSSTIPLNITLIGPPGCTKSGFLERLAAISGDPYMDAGNTTIKGLLPSFAPKSQSPGAMATARTFVLCNEFFDLMKNAQNNEGTYDILRSMKTILEGKVAKCSSGVGSMDVVMRGSAIFGSNWLSFGKTFLTSVSDMYEKLDKALLDRILLYPVPTEFQMKMKNMHERRVKELFNKHTLLTGETDEIKIIANMDTPYPLNTYDLRTLITFKENLVARMEQEAIDELIAQGSLIQEKNGVEIYTRAQEFIANIASAYAFEAALVAGKVDSDTKEIQIMPEHVRAAGSYYQIVIRRHKRENENKGQQRKEYYLRGATKGQKFILDALRTKFQSATDAQSAKVPLDLMVMEYERVCSDSKWEVNIRPLLEDKCVLWDGEYLMWLPEELDEAAVQALFLGGNALYQQSDVLLRNHLVTGNGIGGQLEHGWLNEQLPIRPTEEVQKLLLEALNAYNPQPATVEELRTKMPSLAQHQIENALRHMNLAGRLVLIRGKRYGLKPTEAK